MVYFFITSVLDRLIGRVSVRTYRLRKRGTRPKHIMRVVYCKKNTCMIIYNISPRKNHQRIRVDVVAAERSPLWSLSRG